MKDETIIKIVAIICLTILGIAYFAYIRQDSTVFLGLSSIIGGIAGYQLGKIAERKRRKAK